MKTTKQLLALLLAAALVFCGTSLVVSAQSAAVMDATEKLAAIPDISGITDPESQAYTDAIDAAWDGVYALAECSEDEMLAMADYHKPFDTLMTLWLMPADPASAPTDIPTDETVLAQCDWLWNAVQVLNHLPDDYSLIASYTSPISEDGYTLMGEEMLEELVDVYYDVAIRIEAYTTTLTDEEQALLDQQLEERYGTDMEYQTDAQQFAEKVAQFPDEFTTENILDYAYAFYSLCDMVDYMYDLTQVNQEDLDKFYRLEEEFQVVIGIHHAQVTEQLEQRIDEICDIEKVSAYSPLKMQLIEEERCSKLRGTIYTIQSTLGKNTESFIDNMEQFYEYYSLVYDYPYEPPYTAGDPDDDGEVTAQDALTVLKAVVGKMELTYTQEFAADVDQDGETSAQDALYILQYVVGKLDYLPVYTYAVTASDWV